MRISVYRNESSDDTTESTEYSPSRLVQWEPPPDPNGPVLRYVVKLMSKVRGSRPVDICVSLEEFANHGNGTLLPNLSPGIWDLQVRVVTLWGAGEWTQPIEFEVEDEFSQLFIIVGVVIVALLVVLVIGAVFFYKQRSRMQMFKRTLGDWVEEDPEFIQLYRPDEWELNRNDIELVAQIGNGTFGTVFRGMGKNVKSLRGVVFGECAVKCVRGDAKPPDR